MSDFSNVAYEVFGSASRDIGSAKESVTRSAVPSMFKGRAALASGLPLFMAEGRFAAPEQSGTRRVQLAVKRMLDVVLSLLALLFLAPLLLIVAAIIRLTSPGPALFVQLREGTDGEIFNVYKFRSMQTHACDHTGVAQTAKNDPRVTAIGRFIRKTSIDELPQLLNVLKGDMSLVGPRPHVPDMLAGGKPYRIAVPYYAERLVMRPGLTGWAQANGLRGSTEDIAIATARIDHDLAYVQNFSIWLDLKIMALTLLREFIGGSGH